MLFQELLKEINLEDKCMIDFTDFLAIESKLTKQITSDHDIHQVLQNI